MADDKTPVQADGGGKPAKMPTGREGGGESGGGAYKETNVETGDNRERDHPVETGKEPK